MDINDEGGSSQFCACAEFQFSSLVEIKLEKVCYDASFWY